MPHTDTPCSPTTVSPPTTITSLWSSQTNRTIGLITGGDKAAYSHGVRKTTSPRGRKKRGNFTDHWEREDCTPVSKRRMVGMSTKILSKFCGCNVESIKSSAASLFWNGSPTTLNHRCLQASNKTRSLLPSGWRYWRLKHSGSGFKDSSCYNQTPKQLTGFKARLPHAIILTVYWLLIISICRCHLCATPTVVFLQCFSFTCNFQCLLTVNLHMEFVLHYSCKTNSLISGVYCRAQLKVYCTGKLFLFYCAFLSKYLGCI